MLVMLVVWCRTWACVRLLLLLGARSLSCRQSLLNEAR